MDQFQSVSRTEQIRKMRDRTEPVDRQQEYWTEEELGHLETMFHDCVGITDMALALGRSELAVINRIKAYYRRVRAPRQCKVECQCRKCSYYIGGICTRTDDECETYPQTAV